MKIVKKILKPYKYRNAIDTFFPGIYLEGNLSEIKLKPITLYPPNVDGSSITRLDYIAESSSFKISNTFIQHKWGFRLASKDEFKQILSAVNSMVVTNTYTLDNFNFSSIESIRCSKKFNCFFQEHRASKYKDALTWGENLTPDESLDFRTDNDFEKNKKHILGKDKLEKGININIFGWHNNRVLWKNTDGSHHAAALVHQMIAQNREFKLPAQVTEYQLNLQPFEAIKSDYYLIIANNVLLTYYKHGSRSSTKYLSSVLDEGFGLPLEIAILQVYFPNAENNVQRLSLFAIKHPKKAKHNKIVRNWISDRTQRKELIDFYELIENTERTIQKYTNQ